jgi:hypothetical protein
MNRLTLERTLGLGFFLIAAIVIFCLQGCATLGGGNMTIDQKAAIVKATTATATSVGLGQIEDVDERSEVAATIVIISDKVVKVLDNNGPVRLTGENVTDILLGLVPPDDLNHTITPEIRVMIASVVDLLIAQVNLPDPADLVDADTLALVRAGLEGIRYGAQVHVASPVTFLGAGGAIETVYPARVIYDNIENYNVKS